MNKTAFIGLVFLISCLSPLGLQATQPQSGEVTFSYDGKVTIVGSIVHDGSGGAGRRKIVMKPTVLDGYCIRAEFELPPDESDGKPDSLVEQINEGAQTRTYALQEKRMSCEPVQYFEVDNVSVSRNLHGVVGDFLARLFRWRNGIGKSADNFVVYGRPDDIKCVKDSSGLGITTLAETVSTQSVEEDRLTNFYLEFSKCVYAKGEALAATVKYDGNKNTFVMRLSGPVMRGMRE